MGLRVRPPNGIAHINENLSLGFSGGQFERSCAEADTGYTSHWTPSANPL